MIIEDWRLDYNRERPHTAHGHLPPAEFAAPWNINSPQVAWPLDHSSGPAHGGGPTRF